MIKVIKSVRMNDADYCAVLDNLWQTSDDFFDVIEQHGGVIFGEQKDGEMSPEN